MTESEEKRYKLLIKLTCHKCGKDYGKSNLLYQNCEIWIACDCMDKNLAVFVDTNKIDWGNTEIFQAKEIQ